MERAILAIVLAAGEGTRMKSDMPKVMHRIAGRSMLGHVLTAVSSAGITDVAVVTGPTGAEVEDEARRYMKDARIFTQTERRGTAHAVLAAREAIEGGSDILVLFGDTPLITPETIRQLAANVQHAAVSALGFEAKNPHGYGRLVTEGEKLLRIVEQLDANEAEKAITLCNSGLMALAGETALRILDRIGNRNAKGEYYLTDAVAVAGELGLGANFNVAGEDEVLGINDRVQLAGAEAVAQTRLRRAVMLAGATLVAPETTYLSADTTFGRDVVVEPSCVFGPGVTVGDRAVIHAFSHLEGTTVGTDVSVGPFARLRPGAKLATGARIGNFVEIKAAEIGEGAKINHLSYIGDASVGARSNIGAGTITCNYDGYLKWRTEIGDEVFVGSNSALVAPVRIGDGSNVAAGSVITSDVAADALAVARARQREIAGWAKSYRAAKQAQKAAKGS